jgi:hypothetical protein
MGLAMETIYTFFLNYEQYIILLMLLRRYGMAASSPHQPLVHHCRELPVGDLRL